MVDNLSEEEIKKRMDLMKQNCIFCKIIKKEMDSNIVFEDDLCLAILDINPSTQGHLLLMPKEHYMLMPLVPNEVLGHLSIISKYLSELLIETFKAIDVSIYIANGSAAGQQSQHFMIHIIPRYKDDGINFNLNNDEENRMSEEEVKLLVSKLKDGIKNFE